MYTRSYFTEDKKVDIPENYDGNAFREASETASDGIGIYDSSPLTDKENEDSKKSTETFGKGTFFPFFDKLPIKGLFKALPFSRFKDGEECNTPFRFGTEEILICIAALYMFFSKDGDKECAIMLALLLFIA